MAFDAAGFAEDAYLSTTLFELSLLLEALSLLSLSDSELTSKRLFALLITTTSGGRCLGWGTGFTFPIELFESTSLAIGFICELTLVGAGATIFGVISGLEDDLLIVLCTIVISGSMTLLTSRIA